MSNLEYMVIAQTRYDNMAPEDEEDTDDLHGHGCWCLDCQMASAEEYYDAKNCEADYD